MAFQISFCPYRVSINDWSSIQETQFSTPVVFRGDARDLQKLDDCNEELVRQRKEKTEADRLLAEAEAAEAARQVAIEQEEAERLAAIAQEEADRQAAIEKEEADQRALIEREQAEQEAALEKEEVDRAALASAEVQAAEPVAVEDTGGMSQPIAYCLYVTDEEQTAQVRRAAKAPRKRIHHLLRILLMHRRHWLHPQGPLP